jgi:FlaA1/EpsC-like NDP-sugar epimerase
LQRHRVAAILMLHLCSIVAAHGMAVWLHSGALTSPDAPPFSWVTLALVVVCRLAALYAFGLHSGFWRYTNPDDGIAIVKATLASTVVIGVIGTVGSHPPYSLPFLASDAMIFILLLSGLRILKRTCGVPAVSSGEAKRVLIIGAGDAGEMVARDMMRHPSYGRRPIAFLDDNPQKQGLKLRNVPIIGNLAALETAVEQARPDELLIAIPSATPEQTKAILRACKTVGLPVKILPMLSHLLTNRPSVSTYDIGHPDIEDLIGRPEIKMAPSELMGVIRDRSILVTGAGGSIGSELCRQIAALRPARLVLYEQSENQLHYIRMELVRMAPEVRLEVVLGDILDTKKLADVFSANRPDRVFHAAAYKHVPMMEWQPYEAIRNNLIGTERVIEMADRYRAESFLLVSTDKAVYPTSVMGASKRAAEMLTRMHGARSQTAMFAVRFGNVLESSGSVVPLFREQILRGGPVTVTHAEMTRYFISIAEAVGLMLYATLLGKGGETFVLDMGEPHNVADLARTMILFAGFVPDRDVAIQMIGLRPGEKLTECLFETTEQVMITPHPKIRMAQQVEPQHPSPVDLQPFLKMDHTTDVQTIMAAFQKLIPTYTPEKS